MSERRRPPPALLAGLVTGLAVALLGLLTPQAVRERGFDAMLRVAGTWRPPSPPAPKLAFVDIDSASLEAVGPWPWRREVIARLIATANAAGPAALAVDILLAGEDTRSPAAMARRLAAETGRSDLAALAGSLVDGDAELARALAAGPVALGWVLDPRGEGVPAPVPVLARDGAALGGLWTESGATTPPPGLAEAAPGAGALSLPGDEDGMVRRVPLLVVAAGEVRPGLAVEALRLASGASGYLLAGDPPVLGIGELRSRLPPDGLLRLVPTPELPVTLGAGAVLAGNADLAPLAGAIVVLGGSAPELGALRASARDPLTPSALLHLDAMRQLARGIVPVRPAWAGWAEFAAALLLAGLATAAARRLRPLPGLLAVLALVAFVLLVALWLAGRDMLLDPLGPAAAAALAFLAASLAAFSEARLRETRLRRRFEQHLAPGVVERIVADPGSLRLGGERRIVTALFTDIEGFTEATRRAGPEQLVAVLDGYFEGVTRIVGEHGGMVDKLVGDAVHAFFNMPLDLADHPRRALACAVAIHRWTERYRAGEAALGIGLGRTRIGIETGEAIVGDVGVGTKLDYTAHGDAVNMAARLEAANKDFGTAICVGPAAAAACGPELLRPLGRIALRGLGEVEVFTPSGMNRRPVPSGTTATARLS